MAQAVVDSHGNVVITFNVHEERLAAPDLDGQPRVYLPCDRDGCLMLTTAPRGVKTAICQSCATSTAVPLRLAEDRGFCPCPGCLRSRRRAGVEVAHG